MQKLIFRSGDEQNSSTPVSIKVDKNSQISQIKEILAKKIRVDPSRIVLRYKGHVLPNMNSVSECNISSLGLITYYITSESDASKNDEFDDEYVTILLINGPGKPIKVQNNLTINGARSFLAKVLNLPVSTIIYCGNDDEKALNMLSMKKPIDIDKYIQSINNEDENDEYYDDDEEYDDVESNCLLSELPLNDDGTIHFIYQYKLLSFPVYLPNNLIAKSRCRDFATVDTVKVVLANKVGAKPELTVLTYNGEILANDMKIRDIKFVKNGVFRLEHYTPKPPIRKIFIKISASPEKPKNGKLSIKTQTGQNKSAPSADVLCATAHFNEKATIGKAKEKLADFLNCDPENISLIINDPSIRVNDDSLLRDLDIESNAILDAEVDDDNIISGIVNSPKKKNTKEIRNISIKLSNGLVAKGAFNEKATVKKMKEVIAKALNTTTDCLSVINYGDENKNEDGSDNKLIKDLLNVKYSRYSFFDPPKDEDVAENEEESFETESLSVEVGDGYLNPVTFLLEDGKKVTAQFKPSVTIGRAKEVLSKTLNVEPERLIFKFKSEKNDELFEADDDKLLKNMKIGKSGLVFTKITSFPKSQKIKSRDFSNSFKDSEEADYNNYSEDNEIENNFDENEEIYKEENDNHDNSIQEIEEEEEELSYVDNEEEIIDDVKVQINTNNEYSEVKVSLFDEDEAPIQKNKNPSYNSTRPLVFQTDSGKVAKTRFTDTATVGKLKDKMAEALDVNPGNMSLSFGSKDINDNSLLKDVVNDAECNTTTKLVLKQSPTKLKVVKPLILHLEDGREIKSKFRIISTIGMIKETLGAIIKVDPSKLVFYYDDETLTDDLFLSEINILDNECIYVNQE